MAIRGRRMNDDKKYPWVDCDVLKYVPPRLLHEQGTADYQRAKAAEYRSMYNAIKDRVERYSDNGAMSSRDLPHKFDLQPQ